MLICLLVSGNIEISQTGVRDRVCVYKCQKELKETVYTTPQYQCPKKLYIDDPDKKDQFRTSGTTTHATPPRNKRNKSEKRYSKESKIY